MNKLIRFNISVWVVVLTCLYVACPSIVAQDSSSVSDPNATSHPGHPSITSAAGHDFQPMYAGIFENSPASLLVPPIQDAEDWLKENARLDLNFRITMGFQQASNGPGTRTASAQDYRAVFKYHAINWEEGEEGWAGNVYGRLEYRDRIGNIAPYFLNTQIGSRTTTTYGQDEHDFALVQFYWEQFLLDGKVRVRTGKLDPDDYFNLGRWADDYRYFENTLFSAFPASNHPSGGLGVNAQWYINQEWTYTAGFSDVQGRKTYAGWRTFDDGRFFWGTDLTYSPTIRGWGKGNYRFGLEYRDEAPSADKPSDSTVYFNVDQEIVKDVAPFFRFSHSTGRSMGIEQTMSGGIGIDNPFQRKGDACGIGFGYAKADNNSDYENEIEYSTEAFYRWQLSKTEQLTLGYQIINQPIDNPDQQTVGVFEARWVMDF